MIDHSKRIQENGPRGRPSLDPRHDSPESKRDGRGPIWCVMNNMDSMGIEEEGEHELAKKIKKDTIKSIETKGMAE
jgi:hypothetical protein